MENTICTECFANLAIRSHHGVCSRRFESVCPVCGCGGGGHYSHCLGYFGKAAIPVNPVLIEFSETDKIFARGMGIVLT